MPATETAYQLLSMLAESSLHNARQLPAQSDLVTQWNGIGFSLLGFNFVVPMGDLAEMLDVPAYTKLPGVQNWAKGVANVRGRLLPIFDLAAYFGGALSGNRKQRRLLVIDRDSIYAGLIVDQVYGMQYFPKSTHIDKVPERLPKVLNEFVSGHYYHDGCVWIVFYPLKLLQEQRFLDVAIG